jgi:AraC family transcriptional regulator
MCHHCVVMHVGAPINANCRLDDLRQRRLSTPGDLDIIPTGCSASWDEDGPTTMLAIGLTPSLVNAVAREMGLDPDRVSIAPHLQLRDPGIEHIGWAIKEELETTEPQGRLYADSLAMALAARLLHRYAPVAPGQLGNSFSKRRLKNVIDYIRENLASDLSLAELAAVAGLSASHFKSLFKDATDLPVHQYVIQCRVDHAVNLLTHGKTSLSEVASLAGFSDQSHMARCMRRLLGVTPAQVRRRSE